MVQKLRYLEQTQGADVGLVVYLAGILILFRWGMPFRVESHGEVILATGAVDPRGLALDKIFVRCGWVGLILS